MTTNTPRTVGTFGDLLLRICIELQLTEEQQATATGRYERVGHWLGAADSPLAPLRPRVFPQGSMLLRTTNRPASQEDTEIPFDLDLVGRCSVDPDQVHARDLYDKMRARLEEHGDFAKRLGAHHRCLRLDYGSDMFHLDVIPACPDPADPDGVALLIPDKGLWEDARSPIESWRSTDPLRYAAWFDANCAVGYRTEMKMAAAHVDPVPPAEPAHRKAPLRRITQLIKRKRDLDFLGDKCEPSSIMLTTLAAQHYRGEESVADGLERVLDGIMLRIMEAEPGRIMVLNPTDPGEDLAAPLTANAYRKFCGMVEDMRRMVTNARAGRGIPGLFDVLAPTFGVGVVKRAMAAAEMEVKQAHDNGRLGTSAAAASGLTILASPKVQGRSQPMPRSNFHRNDPV